MQLIIIGQLKKYSILATDQENKLKNTAQVRLWGAKPKSSTNALYQHLLTPKYFPRDSLVFTRALRGNHEGTT